VGIAGTDGAFEGGAPDGSGTGLRRSRLAQAAAPHLAAQNLLRSFGQIDEIRRQFAQFSSLISR
jgi:hypothetical protein